MHRRLRPRRHRLRYRVFWLLLDLDEIDSLAGTLRLFSRNRFNALSFYDRDHGDGSGEPLRDQIEQHLAAAGLDLHGGAIRLLAMPRIFGYGFNPLSIYFCYGRDGICEAIVYEVHNTFGERHSYLIAVDNPSAAVIEQHCDKVFHVSPFLGMDMTYRFRVDKPGERVAVAVSTADRTGPLLFAALDGERRAVTDAALLRVLVTHPLLTLKVIGAIHWHALRMLLKGMRLQPRPSPPAAPVTATTARGSAP
jgi:hypothetical protein